MLPWCGQRELIGTLRKFDMFFPIRLLLRVIRSVLLCLPVVLITSCATITRGSHDKLTVVSELSGANVVLSSGEKGVTPTKFVKSRGDNFTVTVSKAGYVPQTVNVESKVSA